MLWHVEPFGIHYGMIFDFTAYSVRTCERTGDGTGDGDWSDDPRIDEGDGWGDSDACGGGDSYGCGSTGTEAGDGWGLGDAPSRERLPSGLVW